MTRDRKRGVTDDEKAELLALIRTAADNQRAAERELREAISLAGSNCLSPADVEAARGGTDPMHDWRVDPHNILATHPPQQRLVCADCGAVKGGTAHD